MKRAISFLWNAIQPEEPPTSRLVWFLTIPFILRRKMRRWFYDGPSVYHYPGRRMTGYRSPNLLIFIWIRSFLVTWMPPAGRVLIVLIIFFGLLASISIEMPAFILACAMVSLFAVDMILGFILRPKLRVSRSHPFLTECGAPVEFLYTVTNTGTRTAWDLMVDYLPLQTTSLPDGVAHLKNLEPGHSDTTSHRVVFEKRGEHVLPKQLTASAFPFGLWQWHSAENDLQCVYAYPSYSQLESLNFPLGREGRQGRELFSAAASQSLEFMGCREFRYGDNPRLIHSPSWARIGKPVVKEFKEEYLPHAALLVDNFLPKLSIWDKLLGMPDTTIEATMMLTAAIAAKLSADDYLLDVFVPGWKEGVHLTETRGEDQLDKVLQLCATVQPVHTPFHPPPGEQLARIEELQNLMLILTDWDEARQTFVQELSSQRIGAKVIVIGKETRVVDERLIFMSQDDLLAGRVDQIP
jgi:uncharacterized protein (DUF58 family)